ncbi:uncharacterized protein LOC135218587 [Macrobrachium nipponense]|uniref:uncharacterized protein LOC135218587 n=1 Tax=Macrobrachium nipponense TaxID=159736 RepID=UPI0030C881CD
MITLDHLAKFSSTYWMCEKFFAFALTIPGIFNIVAFWRSSGEFALLLDGFRGITVHRDFTMKTAVSELLLFVCLGGVQLYSNAVWYVSYTSQIPFLLRVLFFLSFIWLISSVILPPLCYAALGSVLANAFRHTNELLAQALRNNGNDELSIRAINQQLSSLRELQGRLVTMLSLPLLGFCIFMFYMFANYFFYSVVSGLVQDLTVIIPGILVAAFLGFISVTVVGYTADDIQAEASAPIRILLQEELRTSPEDAPHTWNEDPLKIFTDEVR